MSQELLSAIEADPELADLPGYELARLMLSRVPHRFDVSGQKIPDTRSPQWAQHKALLQARGKRFQKNRTLERCYEILNRHEARLEAAKQREQMAYAIRIAELPEDLQDEFDPAWSDEETISHLLVCEEYVATHRYS